MKQTEVAEGSVQQGLRVTEANMIWMNELVKCKDNAPGIQVRLQGEYNHANSGKPLIAINLIIIYSDRECMGEIINSTPQPLKMQIFSKNPAMLSYQEEPTAEEVYVKYLPKVEKYKQIINKYN